MSRSSSRSRLRTSRLAAFALAAAILRSGPAYAGDGWQPLVTQDGVSVEERASADRALPELRAHVEIDASLREVLAVISDVANQTKWMHDCTESRLVRQEDEDVAVIYNRTASPWPVADRDAVLRTEIARPDPALRVTVRFANVDDPAVPERDGVVRMPRLVGEYELVSLSPTRTRVTYHLDIDPGGSLPAWAATRAARDMPLQTLIGLRKQVGARS